MPAAFLLSLVLRASQGSATVAILTTSGLLSQAVVGLEPLQLVLVTLATCFGSLGLSHVNDAGFWVVTRYLGLSVPDGLKTWTVLTTIMGVTGLAIDFLSLEGVAAAGGDEDGHDVAGRRLALEVDRDVAAALTGHHMLAARARACDQHAVCLANHAAEVLKAAQSL